MKFEKLAAVAAVAFVASGAAHAVDIVTKVSNVGTIVAPQVVTYNHNFQSEPIPAQLNFNTATDRFLDEYGFHISGADFSQFTASLDFGTLFQISNLRARLYTGDISSINLGPAAAQAALVNWSSPVQTGQGAQQVIAPVQLAPGDYVLEVRGDITGAFGGAYVGVMNFGAPSSVVSVPEPETYALFFVGLMGVGMMARNRMRG